MTNTIQQDYKVRAIARKAIAEQVARFTRKQLEALSEIQ